MNVNSDYQSNQNRLSDAALISAVRTNMDVRASSAAVAVNAANAANAVKAPTVQAQARPKAQAYSTSKIIRIIFEVAFVLLAVTLGYVHGLKAPTLTVPSMANLHPNHFSDMN